MSCRSEEVAQAEDAQSLSQWFHSLQLKVNATHAKFAQVARDIRAEDEAEDEARYWDKQDDISAARRADREALDGEEA